MYTTEPVEVFVNCNTVASFAAVKAVFERPNTAREITSFQLTIPFSEANNTVPADLLNETATKKITLTCPSREQIRIDSEAFKASKSYAQYLEFNGCDLSQLNYTFLKDLQAMGELYYSSVTSFSSSLGSLPSLPTLYQIRVASSDFEGFDQFPVSQVPAWSELSVVSCPNFQYLPPVLPPLTSLLVNGCPLFKQWDVVTQLSRLSSLSLIGFNEETINNALDAVAASPLVDKLTYFNLNQNGLKQMPSQIQSFSRLSTVYLLNNMISEAKNNSLVFTTPQLRHLDLSSNNLNNIEPAAFQGLN